MIRATIVILITAAWFIPGCFGPEEHLTVTESPEPTGTTVVDSPREHGKDVISVGSIVGAVTDDSLLPLPEATVHLPELNAKVAVGSAGNFRFVDVPVGTYVIEAQAPGHQGMARLIQVEAGIEVHVKFELPPIPVTQPRIEILHHATLIRYYVGATAAGYLVPNACSDRCVWWFPLPQILPEGAVFEIEGNHSVSNPRGWDGLRVAARGYADNSTMGFRYLHKCGGDLTDPNDPCQRLPIKFQVDKNLFDNEDAPQSVVTERVRVDYNCEVTWVCVDDHYETWVSFFYDWEGEIPPDYSVKSGG